MVSKDSLSEVCSIKSAEKVLKVHTHKNGWTTIVELGTNQLVTYDEDMKEIEKIPGKPTTIPQLDYLSYVGSPCCTHYLLVFRGPFNLMKIQLAKIELEEIEEFFAPADKENVVPLIAVCDSEGTTLAGLSMWDGGAINVTILIPNEKPRYNRLDIKFKNIRSVAALELDRSAKYLFLGGSSKENLQGDGMLQAVSLDKKMKEVCMLLFSDNGQRCISKVNRIPDSDKLLVGTTCFVHIVDFSLDRFTTISKIRILEKCSYR